MNRLDISVEEYHAREEISASNLKLYERDGAPDYYVRCVTREVPFDESDAMRLGTCTHLLFEKFGVDDWENYIKIIPSIVPEKCSLVRLINKSLSNRKSSAAKLEPGEPINLKKAAHKRYIHVKRDRILKQGKIWATEDEARMFVGQLEAILRDPVCRGIIECGGNREQPATNKHKGSGRAIRALADLDVPGQYGVDLKTTRMRKVSSFAWDAKRLGYHIQLRHYECVFSDWQKSGIIAVTNKYPYYAMYYEFDDEVKSMAAGKHDWLMSEVNARMMGDQEDPSTWAPEGYGKTNYIGMKGVDGPSTDVIWNGD